MGVFIEKRIMVDGTFFISQDRLRSIVRECTDIVLQKEVVPDIRICREELIRDNRYISDREIRNYLLKESQHYPEFLEPIAEDVFRCAMNLFAEWTKGTEQGIIKSYVLAANKFFNTVTIEFNGVPSDALDEKRLLASYLPGARISDGKLSNIRIRIICPVCRDINTGKLFIDEGGLRFRLSHEIEHAYDDWQELRQSKESITSKPMACGNNALFRDFRGQEEPLMDACGWLCYLSYFSEQKAFATETFSELSNLRANKRNINEKVRQCAGYRNYTAIENKLVPVIQHAELGELLRLNIFLHNDRYRASAIPKINCKNKPTAEEYENYRNKLISWARKVEKSFLRKFFGVVGFYLDKKKEMEMS